MLLGDTCTRNCTFCNVGKGEPKPIDVDEPLRVAKAVQRLGLKHTVITSVTRDDLSDGGASQFVHVIQEIRKLCKDTTVEVLIPDFNHNIKALEQVIAAKPDVINHNIETVPRLYQTVRPMASYLGSLKLISMVKQKDTCIITKSGIMVGLGEAYSEVVETMKDLNNAGCDLLTIGQYLAPSAAHHAVAEYVTPEMFEKYKLEALEIGFKNVKSSPFTRSSYHAADLLCDS